MYFVLSKIVGVLALPSSLALLVGAIGAGLLFTPYARRGRWLAVASVAMLFLLGIWPFANLLIFPLEHRFPPWDPAHGAPDGIIVLGGAIDTDVSAAHGEAALTNAADRVTAVAGLAHRYPSARIIYSGGTGNIFHTRANEAAFALPLLESLGVARERIVLQGRSRNTAEDAAFSREMADPKPGERWLLVTSAYHMPRAIGAFRKAGFPVEPYPVDWRTGIDLWHAVKAANTLADGLIKADTALREWLGLVAYWARGQTSEFFPGP